MLQGLRSARLPGCGGIGVCAFVLALTYSSPRRSKIGALPFLRPNSSMRVHRNTRDGNVSQNFIRRVWINRLSWKPGGDTYFKFQYLFDGGSLSSVKYGSRIRSFGAAERFICDHPTPPLDSGVWKNHLTQTPTEIINLRTPLYGWSEEGVDVRPSKRTSCFVRLLSEFGWPLRTNESRIFP